MIKENPRRFLLWGSLSERWKRFELSTPTLAKLDSTTELPPHIGAARFELATSTLSRLHSNQLSYAPVQATGIEPVTFTL